MVWRVADATDGDATLKRRLGSIFDDEEINIAVARGFAVSVGTEEDDLLRTVLFFEPRDNVVNYAARVGIRNHFC